mmetsp:Transcript_21451/g.69187  ORF Transcript_21451/g.69187 Transcript_21451/m.69187 type:complete len:254 (-) Transcript_21451:886-1647(-)
MSPPSPPPAAATSSQSSPAGPASSAHSWARRASGATCTAAARRSERRRAEGGISCMSCESVAEKGTSSMLDGTASSCAGSRSAVWPPHARPVSVARKRSTFVWTHAVSSAVCSSSGLARIARPKHTTATPTLAAQPAHSARNCVSTAGGGVRKKAGRTHQYASPLLSMAPVSSGHGLAPARSSRVQKAVSAARRMLRTALYVTANVGGSSAAAAQSVGLETPSQSRRGRRWKAVATAHPRSKYFAYFSSVPHQ